MKTLMNNSALIEVCGCTLLLAAAIGFIVLLGVFFAAATPTPAEEIARIAALGCR